MEVNCQALAAVAAHHEEGYSEVKVNGEITEFTLQMTRYPLKEGTY